MEASHNRNADNSGAKRRAEAAMADRQWSAALSAWQAWWDAEGQQANQDPDAMHDRAVCHFHCGEKELAMTWLDKAAEIQPDYSYRYSSRGWMKQAMGDLEGAIEDCKKALDLDPDDAVTWNNLGLLEEQMGYQEQARERYKVSDELLGILNEHGIDPESSSPAFQDRPSPSGTAQNAGPRPAEPEGASPSFWNEMKRTALTRQGRAELWTFIKNGFTLRG